MSCMQQEKAPLPAEDLDGADWSRSSSKETLPASEGGLDWSRNTSGDENWEDVYSPGPPATDQQPWTRDDATPSIGLKRHTDHLIPELTLPQAQNMCKELLEGFSTPDFTRKMQGLMKGHEVLLRVPGRSELALTVQSQVLPKYGIPGSSEGVLMMVNAMKPFLNDPTVLELTAAMDAKLGLPNNGSRAIAASLHLQHGRVTT